VAFGERDEETWPRVVHARWIGRYVASVFHTQINLTFCYYSSLERDTENAESFHRIPYTCGGARQHFRPTLPQLQSDHEASWRILHPFALLPWTQDGMPIDYHRRDVRWNLKVALQNQQTFDT